MTDGDGIVFLIGFSIVPNYPFPLARFNYGIDTYGVFDEY